MSLEIAILLDSSRRPILYTLSDQRLQEFIAAPTAATLNALITELGVDLNSKGLNLEHNILGKLLITGLIKKALKTPRVAQDYIVALVQALSSEVPSLEVPSFEANSAQMSEYFSTLSDCVTMLTLLNSEAYRLQQRLFLQRLTVEHFITLSQTSEDSAIIDLLSLLPAAQQQQYLQGLGEDRLRQVVKDGFILHGVMDSLKNLQTKNILLNLLGNEHLRHIVDPSESEAGTSQDKIQNLAALLRAFKSEDEYNAVLQQLGPDFLFKLLSDTAKLRYFFQQINTDKQRLVLNMLGAERLKMILAGTSPRSEYREQDLDAELAGTSPGSEYREQDLDAERAGTSPWSESRKKDLAEALEKHLLMLMSSLHPDNYPILLNLLGKDWFHENDLFRDYSQLYTGLFYSGRYEEIIALLPFITRPNNTAALAQLAFSYDTEIDMEIDMEKGPLLVENLPATSPQPHNVFGQLPFVTLLWRSLKSEEGQQWVTANHALLNRSLASNLQKWQSQATPATQKYYLSALGNDGILAACITNGSELTNILKYLHKDAQIAFLEELGSDQLKKLIHNWAILGRGALAYLDVEAQNRLLELLGPEHLATLLADSTQRDQVASYLHSDNQRRLNDTLSTHQFWQYLKIAGAALAAVAGLGLLAYVAIPGAASVITALAVNISIGLQSLASTVMAYSWYAMTVCYGLLQSAWINIQAYQGLIFIGALLTGIAGLVYYWFNKDSKPAVATQEQVDIPRTLEHIIIDEAKAKPPRYLSLKFGEGEHQRQFVEPSFAASAETSLQRRRAAGNHHIASDLPPPPRRMHYSHPGVQTSVRDDAAYATSVVDRHPLHIPRHFGLEHGETAGWRSTEARPQGFSYPDVVERFASPIPRDFSLGLEHGQEEARRRVGLLRTHGSESIVPPPPPPLPHLARGSMGQDLSTPPTGLLPQAYPLHLGAEDRHDYHATTAPSDSDGSDAGPRTRRPALTRLMPHRHLSAQRPVSLATSGLGDTLDATSVGDSHPPLFLSDSRLEQGALDSESVLGRVQPMGSAVPSRLPPRFARDSSMRQHLGAQHAFPHSVAEGRCRHEHATNGSESDGSDHGSRRPPRLRSDS